jgi:hypothetical protein
MATIGKTMFLCVLFIEKQILKVISGTTCTAPEKFKFTKIPDIVLNPV